MDTFDEILDFPGVRTAWLNVLASCPDDAVTRTAFLGGVIGGMEFAKTVTEEVKS